MLLMNTSPPPPPQLPILILTGFLGSGKTTLLNRLLRAWPRTAVLINEFGAEPVDPLLMEREGLPLMTLSGGCLCCQVRGALAPVLKNLRMAWGQPGTPAFERIVVETSGVASPEPVLDTLLRDRWLAARYRLEGIVATVAVPSAEDQLARFPEAKAQAAWADALVLTQADLADASTLARAEMRLAELAPAAPRLRAVRGELDPAALLASMGTGLRRRPASATPSDHGFRSLSIHLPEPIPWPRLRSILEDLLARHPDLVRVKGVVYPSDRPEPVAVQGAAGRLFPPVALPARDSDDGRGRLVFIAAGPLDGLAGELQAALEKTAGPAAVERN
jgi:G3E family GTPase